MAKRSTASQMKNFDMVMLGIGFAALLPFAAAYCLVTCLVLRRPQFSCHWSLPDLLLWHRLAFSRHWSSSDLLLWYHLALALQFYCSLDAA
jgi:hypothetical protein